MGRDVQALNDRPDFPLGLELFWEAWIILGRSRGSGFSGPEPIAVGDALAWLDTAGYSETAQIEILSLIQELDQAYIEHVNKKQESKSNADSGTSNRRTPGKGGSGVVPKGRY